MLASCECAADAIIAAPAAAAKMRILVLGAVKLFIFVILSFALNCIRALRHRISFEPEG